MKPWPHQEYAVAEVLTRIKAGERRLCVASPTGGGKTWIMAALAKHHLDHGMKVALYTHRRVLLDQHADKMDEYGLWYGVRADGWKPTRDNFQVCSIHTDITRYKKGGWQLHDANFVLVDEAHQMQFPSARKIMDVHHQEGAAVVEVTATPLDMVGPFDSLIVAGVTSELRACGALVPAVHYGCTEPDLRLIGPVPAGCDLSEGQNRKAIMVPGIFGRVLHWYRQINPTQRPSILFAPGVGESIGFAQDFDRNGVKAAHIDGADIWMGGKFYKSDRGARRAVLEGSRDGEVKVLCNRFVLREGVDAPWLGHGILACVFGSLQSYLQAGGRLLRAFPGLSQVTVQDHGGHWWRHGSLNHDRHWRLGDTNRLLAAERKLLMAPENGQPKAPEPFRCPRCGTIIARLRPGIVCPTCGLEFKAGHRRSRPVIQADGRLVEHTGDIFRPRRREQRNDTETLWRKMYFRAKNSKMTFNQAEALFYRENGYYPPRNLPLMPLDDINWYKPVRESDTPLR